MMDNEVASTTVDTVVHAKPGKYLTFTLGSEQYGLDIMKVQEIIGMMPVTRVPKTAVFLRGVINLRGKVIPIVDLRLKFDMEEKEDTRRTCIVVMQVNDGQQTMIIGLVVDEVAEVIDIDAEHLQPPPSLGAGVDTEMIVGIGRVEERVIMLLDADRLFSADEMSTVKGIS